ncbi:hypothetical protein ACFP2T_24280 [Plantactinospora solaniradicis]|uniref:Lipoprotein n=1 Tax=Plantactinospora solaniradicis TaxID=1723736 RepID=A0ABW1KBX8_9ACTN
MTSPRQLAGRLAALSALVMLGAGCGVIDTVQNAVDAATTVTDFADRLGKSAELTFTAEYKIVDNQQTKASDKQTNVTVAQQPPNSALITGDGRLIFTPEHTTICDGKECNRTPNTVTATTGPDATAVASVAGPGFVTPELALGLVTAAAMVPNADVGTSERKIAGQDTLCANVTGISDPLGTAEGTPGELTVCVTDSGLLAAFTGRTETGEEVAVELVKYSEKVNKSAFAPPAGAKVVDAGGAQG